MKMYLIRVYDESMIEKIDSFLRENEKSTMQSIFRKGLRLFFENEKKIVEIKKESV